MSSREYHREYYRAHRRELIARQQQRQRQSKDKVSEYNREYYQRKKYGLERQYQYETVPVTLEEAYTLLAENMLKATWRDWLRGDEKTRQDIIGFLMSDAFDLYCDLLGRNPDCEIRKYGIRWQYSV